MEKRKHSQKIIDTIIKLKEKHSVFAVKLTDDFIDLLKSHTKEIDSHKTPEKFMNMIHKRQAAKYYEMTEEEFEALQKKQLELFRNAKKMSNSEVEEIRRINEAAVEKRKQKKAV